MVKLIRLDDPGPGIFQSMSYCKTGFIFLQFNPFTYNIFITNITVDLMGKFNPVFTLIS